MNTTLSHRGPDAAGFFQSENVFLGHTRLSIIDLQEHANQPFYSEDKEWVLVYNGEVYNYEELRIKYKIDCKTSSDTEVILKVFQLIGVDVFNELNGMFALVIYHLPTKKLFLARDRMGKKPLFLFQNNGGLAFSSELKGLWCLPEIKSKLTINHQAVSSFLHLGYIPAPLTIHHEIQKFPSGCYGKYEEGKLEITPFWQLENKIEKEVLKDEKVAIQQLDSLLNNSVNLRLKSDVPFGTFLSGGIDSSLITALAQKNASTHISTFSIGFKEKSHNESVFAAQVAKEIGTHHNEFIVSEKDAMNLVSDMFSTYDEPYADTSAIPSMLVSKLARNKVKMVLTGDGGDELFHGYGFYKWAERLNQPLIKTFKKPISKVLSNGNQKMKRAATLFAYPKNQLTSHIFSQEQYFFSKGEVKNLLAKDFVDFPAQLNQKFKGDRKLTPAEEQSIFDLQFYLQDELLTKVDRASMKYGLEARVPLLDYRIVEFALNLSPELKIKNGEQKYLLKQLLYNYLPKALFDRPKQGFSVPLAIWLKGELNYLIQDYLSETAVAKTGWLNWKEVERLLNQFYAGDTYLYHRIWALIVLQQFFSEK